MTETDPVPLTAPSSGDGVAAVVLAGGRSHRMGSSKASLAWGGTTLLARTCAVLGAAGSLPVVVVRGPAQQLPALPPGVEVVDDEQEGLGPVHGLAVGLRCLAGRAEVVFVAATDLPHLHPAFVRRMVRALAVDPAVDVALPVAHGHAHPLAAAYRARLADVAADAVRLGRLRLMDLVDSRAALRLDESMLLADDELRAGDPSLRSLVNVNDPGEYRRARDASRG